MTDGLAHDNQAFMSLLAGEDDMAPDPLQAGEDIKIADHDLQIPPGDAGGDEHAVYETGVVGRDQQRAAGRDLGGEACVGTCYESGQESAAGLGQAHGLHTAFEFER